MDSGSTVIVGPWAQLAQAAARGADEDQVKLATFESLVPEARVYLWPPYLPGNVYGVIGGKSGVGKTTLGIAMCAWASRGKWPDGYVSDPVKCLIIEKQDGDADEIKPKLIANGYEPSMVMRLDGKKKMPTLPALEQAIVEHGLGIVLLSPLNAFVTRSVKDINSTKRSSRCLTI